MYQSWACLPKQGQLGVSPQRCLSPEQSSLSWMAPLLRLYSRSSQMARCRSDFCMFWSRLRWCRYSRICCSFFRMLARARWASMRALRLCGFTAPGYGILILKLYTQCSSIGKRSIRRQAYDPIQSRELMVFFVEPQEKESVVAQATQQPSDKALQGQCLWPCAAAPRTKTGRTPIRTAAVRPQRPKQIIDQGLQPVGLIIYNNQMQGSRVSRYFRVRVGETPHKVFLDDLAAIYRVPCRTTPPLPAPPLPAREPLPPGPAPQSNPPSQLVSPAALV